MPRLLVIGALVLASLLAAGCGGDDDGEEAAPTTTATAAGDECTPESLETETPGKLTIGTDDPAFPPWFEGTEKNEPWSPTDAPTKKGYEAEVAYAIAEELGFSDADVEWTVVPFNRAFAPGPKSFDFDINQISYAPERAQAVDFSDSYYDVEQSVVAAAGTPIANAEALDDLKEYRFGAQIGTTSYRSITEVIEPEPEPSVYDTNNDAVSALNAKQVDGIVVDYPTALYVANVQLENGTIVGRLPPAGGRQEYFGLVFEKGSPLVECVNGAIATLRENGTLDRLEQKWIAGSAPPVLE